MRVRSPITLRCNPGAGSMTDPVVLLQEQVKTLTKKVQKQRNEIGRLTRDNQALKDDLVDIRTQRNTLQARLLEVLEKQK